MRTIVVHRTLKAPIEEVFDFYVDSAKLAQLPGVRSVTRIREGRTAPDDVGTLRKIDLGAIWLQEEIVGLQRPSRFDYRIRDARPKFHHEAGTIAFQTVPEGTEVTWTSAFTLGRPVLDRLAAPLGAKAFDLVLWAIERKLTAEHTRATTP